MHYTHAVCLSGALASRAKNCFSAYSTAHKFDWFERQVILWQWSRKPAHVKNSTQRSAKDPQAHAYNYLPAFCYTLTNLENNNLKPGTITAAAIHKSSSTINHWSDTIKNNSHYFIKHSERANVYTSSEIKAEQEQEREREVQTLIDPSRWSSLVHSQLHETSNSPCLAARDTGYPWSPLTVVRINSDLSRVMVYYDNYTQHIFPHARDRALRWQREDDIPLPVILAPFCSCVDVHK